jgi:acyl-CoA synthetase (AMP-forming)/AMP-acid ligase II
MIGCRVAIRRPDGSFADPGEHGEVVARGDLRARGYWRQPHKFAEMFADGWLATGDVGYLDADGFLYLVDRIKDMIIRKGENIYSAEVERVLSAHPQVAEIGVFGAPHPLWGEQVAAHIVLVPGAAPEPAAISEDARERLATYKVPTEIEFVAELPKNAMGKVLKRELRASWSRAHP